MWGPTRTAPTPGAPPPHQQLRTEENGRWWGRRRGGGARAARVAPTPTAANGVVGAAVGASRRPGHHLPAWLAPPPFPLGRPPMRRHHRRGRRGCGQPPATPPPASLCAPTARGKRRRQGRRWDEKYDVGGRTGWLTHGDGAGWDAAATTLLLLPRRRDCPYVPLGCSRGGPAAAPPPLATRPGPPAATMGHPLPSPPQELRSHTTHVAGDASLHPSRGGAFEGDSRR